MPAPEPPIDEGHVYLFQVRLQPKGKRTKHDQWTTEGVYRTRAEADAHATGRKHKYPHGYRVCGVPAEGALLELVKGN
ncbi:hypothetical protein VT84_09190 [Gemmata sp. SH-PL17]|uniref:hypothetical protein n=1 Tax=Gemmata sp. SH-PL17 TaxID=1630693 RepID=UPI00078D8C1A|nr:hypothetical protein [Gemmata sp. SH-PL17]AMV24557.1 hypothetical protein VT84_09190 [Gemmata sp. SH-PL17]